MYLYTLVLIFIIIIAPFSLIWHELGHVFGAKIVKASHVTLTIGLGKPILKRSYQNVTIIICKMFLFNSLTETKRPYLLSRRDKVIITFMGPISSLLLGLVAYCLYIFVVPHLLLYGLFLFNMWIGLINLIPFKINERQSDGYTILQMIKNKYD